MPKQWVTGRDAEIKREKPSNMIPWKTWGAPLEYHSWRKHTITRFDVTKNRKIFTNAHTFPSLFIHHVMQK